MKIHKTWKEYILSLDPEAEFRDPATPGEIDAVESSLGVHFPILLKEILLETNGVFFNYGTRLIWSVERIGKINREFRSLPALREMYLPFDQSLFFGDAGNGDQYAFPILNSKAELEVIEWNHEDDSRCCYAQSLENYIKKQLTRYQ